MIVTAGATLYIEKTGDYINCRAEWILQENGEYLCPKTNATSLCYEIEYRGGGWHRCWTGRLVTDDYTFPDEKDYIPNSISGIGDWICHPPPKHDCVKKGKN